MDPLGEIGTLPWVRRTRGLLSRSEQARLLAAMAISQARGMPSLVAARAGRGGIGPDPSEVVPPDSAICREVLAESREVMPETVVEHSLRSFMFAVALGDASGLPADPEQLFVGALFHDRAIEQIDEIDDCCFTLPSAERTLDLARAHGWEEARAEATAEAITMHLNPEVSEDRGAVQHLVHDGVFLDIFAIRSPELDRDGVRRTFLRHPRGDFFTYGPGRLRDHAARVPRCRVAAAFKGGFGLALKLSPHT